MSIPKELSIGTDNEEVMMALAITKVICTTLIGLALIITIFLLVVSRR